MHKGRDSMRGPQLEDGYTRIANTLLEAIYQTKFNATQLKILLLIIRYTYGFNRKSHDLSLSFIEKATGISKRYVSSELNRLIENRVVIVYENHTNTQSRRIGLNKNYTEWGIRSNLPQLKNPSTVEEKQDTTVEQSFNTTVEQSFNTTVEQFFNQERQYKDNIKDIEEDEEERVPSPEKSDKVPSLCQEENDPVLKFLNQVSSYYTTLTGRLTSPNDEVAITDISKHTTNFEIVKEAMDNTFRNYKPRYKGDKIRSFRYFVPGILERIAIEKERQRRREVKVANGNEFLGTETERAPKFDKSKFLYKGG